MDPDIQYLQNFRATIVNASIQRYASTGVTSSQYMIPFSDIRAVGSRVRLQDTIVAKYVNYLMGVGFHSNVNNNYGMIDVYVDLNNCHMTADEANYFNQAGEAALG